MNDLYTLEGRELLHQLSAACEATVDPSTDFSSEATTTTAPVIPWNVYPRPQLRRESFFCLNGYWDFAVTPTPELPADFDRRILVPFAPETLLSGVHERFSEVDYIWYHRSFSLPADFMKTASDRVLLHIGAADQKAVIWVNGQKVGEHVGGYEAFSFDITEYLRREAADCESPETPFSGPESPVLHTIDIQITDNLSQFVLPYGKQCQKRGGMWYTPTTGIWQTVWLECVPASYIRHLKIDTGNDYVSIIAEGADSGTLTVQTPTGTLSAELTHGHARLMLPAARLWSPEDPYLYEFTIDTPSDHISSYFALRALEVKTVDGLPRLCLNGRPYFFHGLLDQGYWSDGLLTPASPEDFVRDIEAMKSLGFNMLRKHIKIEPELFYYECDRLGMVVFQDFVNNGDYSFVRDTVLPTIGWLRRSDRRLHRDAATRRAFVTHMEQTVRQLYNHPCICYWTIFNEGWGQFCSSEMYARLRALDGSRFIDSASGWFAGGDTDVDSRHVYFRKVKLPRRRRAALRHAGISRSCASLRPLVLSEFGGYTWKPEGHVYNTDKTYGYGGYSTREEFVDALRSLYTEQVLPLIPQGLCAAVYTQVSDVEDETNGLYSFDREVLKVQPAEFADVSESLIKAI